MVKVSIIFYLLLQPFLAYSQKIEAGDYYEQGNKMAEAGEWRQALRTWLKGKSQLENAQKIDPRIGLKFIELATTHEAKEFYPAACELYFWALEVKNTTRFKNLFSDEIEMTQPILSKAQYKDWQQLLQQDDPQLITEIKTYWEERDPTPSTSIVNERLLEHWQRISQARKMFKKSKSGILGTDERGLIYVQFGEPDIINQGNLGTNRLVYKRWTDILALMNRASRGAEERFIQAVERYNRNPEYILWTYSTLDPAQPVFYLFGRRGGSGSFGLRNGVEELIPDGAFLRSNTRYTSGVLPGAVLQTIYYGEIMHLNDFFAKRLHELDRAWVGFESQGSFGFSSSVFRDLRSRFQLLEKEEAAKRNVPPERSTFDREVIPVDLVLQPVRLLNDYSQPVIAFVALTYPQIDQMDKSERVIINTEDYQIYHTLRLMDENQNEINRFVDQFPFDFYNASTFKFPHHASLSDYQFFVEIFKLNAGQTTMPDSTVTDPASIATGLGRTNFESDPPLSTATDSLELSDLVIGIESPLKRTGYDIPFPVTPTNEIQQPQALKVYFEIYRLLLDENSTAHYTINYQVARLHGRKQTKKEMISLSYDFDTSKSTSRETFDIDISKLKPGDFEFQIEVTDRVSGQKKQRSVPFTILEDEN